MTDQPSYRYSHTVGFNAVTGGRGFNNPVDMAFGPDGVMYVLNRAGPDLGFRMAYKRVTICTVTQEYLGQFSTGGTGDGEMMWPVSIAIDEDGRVYVSDEALHRISIFDRKGQFLGKWGTRGQGDGEFDGPSGIAFDRGGNLLVVDGLNHRVQRYTKHGIYLGGWGKQGAGDGEFTLPWGIAVDRVGSVYVADWRNDRIQKFGDDGGHLATWGVPGPDDGQFYRPAGVTVDSEGYIYVADWGNERVQVLGSDGSFVTKLLGDSGLSKWADEYYVSNMDELEARNLADLEPQPDLDAPDFLREKSNSIEKLFWGPTSVKVDNEGHVCVVESCRYRIQVYLKEPSPARTP